MLKVRFIGTSNPGESVGAAQVDEVVLERNGEPQEVTKKQLERLRDLHGHRFEVQDGKDGDK